MRPPQHSARAPIEFLDLDDPETLERHWHGQTWSDELDYLPEGDPRSQEHPMALYRSGKTRYDLSAPGTVYTEDGPVQKCPRDYIREDSKPPIVRLSRLRPGELSLCKDKGGLVGASMAFAAAFVSVDNCPIEIEMNGRKRGLTDSQVEQLADVFGMEWVWKAGKAAMLASQVPTYAEKKP